MTRKTLTEEQKAQTEFTDLVVADYSTVEYITATLKAIGSRLNLNPRESAIALRDYSQMMVGRYMDTARVETEERIAELQKKLKGR